MNKEIRNTIVYDFIGTAFCLVMAFALILMFSGCSNDESKQPVGSLGGAEEETGIYALSGQVGDIIPKTLSIQASSDTSIHPNSTSQTTLAKSGTIIAIYELDSVTFSKTGKSYIDTLESNDGRFKFNDFPLHSPYVLIETQEFFDSPECPTCTDWDSIATADGSTKYIHILKAIVNLDEIKKISINTLTNMKVTLLQQYLADGMTFTEANKKAEREILKDFGIYVSFGQFEMLPEGDSELSYVIKLSRDLHTYSDYLYMNLESYIRTMLFIPTSVITAQGTNVEAFFENTKKMVDYEIGYLAQMKGFGQCTESREGEMKSINEFPDGPFTIVCRSEKWTIGFKTVKHTIGSVTDNRDGKTYKTVTYNLDGVSQTWMAENLNFDATSPNADSSLKANLKDHSFCHDQYCEIYGRYYSWYAAMNIGDRDVTIYSVNSAGDTIFLEQKCLDAVTKECPEDDLDCMDQQRKDQEDCSSKYLPKRVGANDSAMEECFNSMLAECNNYEEECDVNPKQVCDSLYGGTWTEDLDWSLSYTEHMSQKDANNYQGVCPDGWRIPTLNDWKTLLQMMGKEYDVDDEKAGIVLYDEDATGFGIKNTIYDVFVYDDFPFDEYSDPNTISLNGENWYNSFIIADALTPTVTFLNAKQILPIDKMDFSHHENRWYTTWASNYYSANVRCIKN